MSQLRVIAGVKLSYGKKLFLLAIPFMIYVFVFSYLPLYGWVYAFFDYKPGIPLLENQFVGTRFFTDLFSTSVARRETLRVLKNTFLISFLNLLTAPIPVLFAIFLSEMRFPRARRLIQTVTTLPNFISWVLVYSVFYSIFALDDGFFNRLGSVLIPSWQAYNPISDRHVVWQFQTIVTLWKTLGWNAIIYLAAITSIDQEQYDAAKVDGASRIQTIWHITVPGILPTFFVLLLLQVSNIVNNGLEQYFMFQNPMTKSSIEVLDLYVYNQGIANIYYSSATAISVMKSLVSVTLLFLVNTLSKAVRGNSIF